MIAVIDERRTYNMENNYSKLVIKNGKTIFVIPVDNIYFIEKVEKKCLIHVEGKTYETNRTITDIYNNIGRQSFYLSHRSYIINVKKVSRITSSGETYLAHFYGIDEYAYISRLKIKEVISLLVK